MNKLIKIAIAQLGQKEITGEENNPAIVNYARESGFTWVNDDETPWCSIFMNWVCMKAGLERSYQANARSWLNTGVDAGTDPRPGDIVVFWRNSPDRSEGHVGIFFGYSANGAGIFCLGGNQSNQVSISEYPARKVLGFRRLREEHKVSSLPSPILMEGDRGSRVKTLQRALRTAGYDCGPADSIFGPLTTSAIRQLQKSKPGIAVDGIYGNNTRSLLEEKIK